MSKTLKPAGAPEWDVLLTDDAALCRMADYLMAAYSHEIGGIPIGSREEARWFVRMMVRGAMAGAPDLDLKTALDPMGALARVLFDALTELAGAEEETEWSRLGTMEREFYRDCVEAVLERKELVAAAIGKATKSNGS